MRTSIKALWIAVVVGLLIMGAPVVAQDSPDSGNLTGTYLLDARPTQLVYLSLTQSASFVSGYAVIVEPTIDPQLADALSSRTFTIEGTTSNTSVTLVLGDWASGQFTMTGSKEDEALILTYPTTSGEIGTAIFQSTSQHAFNETVSEWRAGIVAENELWALMPGDDLMPPGIVTASGSGLTKDAVADLYPEVTKEQLLEWGWLATISGWFSDLEALLPATHTTSITVTVHRFSSPEEAREAFVTFSHSSINDQLLELDTEPLGDQTRVLSNLALDEDVETPENQSKIYLRAYATVILINGISIEGNPTPVVVELAKRMVDPAYAEAQAQKTLDMIDQSAQLDNQIADMYDTATSFSGQIEVARLDFDDVQAALDDMEVKLENVRIEASAQPMDCWQAESVDFTHETLELATETFDLQRERFDTTIADLEAELGAVDQTIASTHATAGTLKESIEASPYPPPPLYALPGDEEPAVIAYKQAAETARLDLKSLQTDYNDLVTRADEIMSEGETIVEDTQALANCGNQEGTSSDVTISSVTEQQSEQAPTTTDSTTTQEQEWDDQEAAEAAREISRLEAAGDFDALYEQMHPDAQAFIPREAVVGWFGDYYAGKETMEMTVTGVKFVSWTWPVTGVTYPNTAEVSFIQPIWEGGEYSEIVDVVRLVQGDDGEWHWFFGRSWQFVEDQIDIYAP